MSLKCNVKYMGSKGVLLKEIKTIADVVAQVNESKFSLLLFRKRRSKPESDPWALTKNQ